MELKNQNGTYVFERDASEPTLRPAYEPKDSQGIIYDKPYPLYNFSVAFYYKLKAADQSYLIPNLNPKTAINKTTIKKNITTVYIDGVLQVNTDVSNISRIDLRDISGKMITSFILENNIIEKQLKFQLPPLSKGIYLVSAVSSSNNYVSKLIIK